MESCPPLGSGSPLSGSVPSPKPGVVTPFEPIAVVGIGMRAPGGISDLTSLWDTIIQRKSHHACLSTDPRFLRRFSPKDFDVMFSVTPDARKTLHGNLLDETPGLDESYFGVSKRDSACMDVQQKLLLHVAYEALEDAGFSGVADGSSLDPSSFGVYIGAGTDDFLKDPNSYPIDIYHLVRNQRAFLSGQISHHFGLHGPSVSVDTVCAGAMTAFNDACRALASGECRAAIAGGVHVMSPITTPPTVMSLKLAGFLDPTGQCKPFLADGGGYCRAEACGLAVLKRLSDAVRDGDRIHGIIRGMGAGNMSSLLSIVRPNGPLQAASLAQAVASSGIDPADITFVEAHGPGTQQGDPAELYSICSVLAQPAIRGQDNPLVIGSIKGNVGHSEAASGAISLFKVLAMMRYRKIAPQANFNLANLNPRLTPFFDHHSIRISDREQDWSPRRRIAIVSNFGASGYAGHMVIEATGAHSMPTPVPKDIPLPFLVSAKDQSALLSLVQIYSDWLRNDGMSVPFPDLSYATTARRILHSHIAILRAKSTADLVGKLDENTLTIIDATSREKRTVGFCFSGQGGPCLDPRKTSVYGVSAAFSSVVDSCFQISEDERLFAPEDLEILELFALQAGLATMWTAWGVIPTVVAGHSFGEYNALVQAGVITLRDALALVGTRAVLIREKCCATPSRMAALQLPLKVVHELLELQSSTEVELACINTDDRVTLAGTPEDLTAFYEDMIKPRYPTPRWRMLENMKAAFHSRFVEPLRSEFVTKCEATQFHLSKCTLLSGPLGRMCPSGDSALLHPDYLFKHCRETNQFGKAILDYQLSNEATGVAQPDWIEIGPHSTTLGFIPTSGETKVPSQRKDVDGWDAALDAMITIFTEGHPIDFAAFHHDVNPTRRHIDLPKYPFKLQPHSYPVRKTNAIPEEFQERVSHPRVTSSDLSPIMKSHMVVNQPICPASVYISLALSASGNTHTAFRVSRLMMSTPFSNLTNDWLRAHTLSVSEAASRFEVASMSGQVHASMQVDQYDNARLLDSLRLLKPLVAPLKALKGLPGTNILDTRLAYDLFSQTVRYDVHCQGMQCVWLTGDGYQAWALSSNESGASDLEPVTLQRFSPILIDRACQLIGLLINTSPLRSRGEIFVASEVDQVEIDFESLRGSPSLESYASFELTDNTTAVGQVFTFDCRMELVATFRGVRMQRMKQSTIERIIRKTLGEEVAPGVDRVVPQVVHHPPPSFPSMNQEPVWSTNDILRQRISAIVEKTLGIIHLPRDRPLREFGLDSRTAVKIGLEIARLPLDRKNPGEQLFQDGTTLKMLFDTLGLLSPDTPNITGSNAEPTKPTLPPGLCGSNSLPSPPLTSKAESEESIDDQLRRNVIEVVEAPLGMKGIPWDTKLGEIGLDSLTAIEIGAKLERLLPDRKLPGGLLVQPDMTLQTVLQALRLSMKSDHDFEPAKAVGDGCLAEIHRESFSNSYTTPPDLDDRTSAILDHIGANPEVIQEQSGPLPLILIHDGSGTALAYRSLGNIHRTLLGIHSPGLRDGTGIQSIRHAADQYASLARQWLGCQTPPHPSRIIVGGWSLGGTIAFALAAAHPDLVSGVVLLDPPPPGTAAMTSQEAELLIPSSASHPSGFAALIQRHLKMNGQSLSRDINRQGRQRTLFVGLKVSVYLISASDPLPDVDQTKLAFSAGSCSEWMLSPDPAALAESAWSHALGDLLVGAQRTPGNHFSMFSQVHSKSTTQALQSAIRNIESVSTQPVVSY